MRRRELSQTLGMLAFVACVSAVLCSLTPAAVIDDFSTANAPATISSTGVTVVTDSPSSAGGVFGGSRTSILQQITSDIGPSELTADGGATGTMSVNNVTNTASEAIIGWTGLSGDFSPYNALSLEIVALDQPGVTFQVEMIGPTGTDRAFQTQTALTAITGGDPSYLLLFPYSSFTFENNFSFSSVNVINLTVNPPDFDSPIGFDVTFDNFEAVPEPSTYALFGLVCVGVAVYHRRRKLAARKSKSESQS